MLDLLRELERRDAGLHARRGRSHRGLGDAAGLGHHLELELRLHAAELVHEWRHVPDARTRHGLLEVEDGLAPRASADAEPPDVAKRASGGREQRLAVVGLVDDDGLPRLAPFEVEDEHHPRQHVERLAPRREEGADDPAVGVGGLTEARHVPGEPGEVLEVGRRLQKDRVDACLVEPRREDLAATCELGLGERLVHHGCILPRLDWPRCPLSVRNSTHPTTLRRPRPVDHPDDRRVQIVRQYGLEFTLVVVRDGGAVLLIYPEA